MRRFWIDSQVEENQSEISLEGDVLHHVRDVCRMVVGAKFEVLTEDRKAYLVELIRVDKKVGLLKVLEQRIVPEIPGPRVTLYLSLPKFATFENVVEKSVELGVHKIQPFFSDYSFVRSASKLSPSRLQRWQKIVRGATQQSGRGELMSVGTPCPLSEVMKDVSQQKGLKGLFAFEGDSHIGLREKLSAWSTADEVTEVALFVGSEGGFSSEEVELFREHEMEPVTLGDQILRVETACVALISILKYHFKALG